VQFAQAVAPFRPLWIEEPTLRENPAGLGEVAAKSLVPVASGEGLFSRFEFKALLDARGASVVQPDVLHAGGITEIRKIANLAETYGIEIAPHQCSGPIGHVASLCAMSVCRNFLIQEWEAADDAVFRDMTNNSYPVQRNGYVTLSDAPGLGLQINFEEFTRRHPYSETRRKALLR
jgi:galactonate dehydratase